jgi:hypothetical protein
MTRGRAGRTPRPAPVLRMPQEQGRNVMNTERSLRMIAGAFVAASVLLGIYVNPLFFWLTLFVGLNLFQSAFTQWCPMMTILRKAGVRD